MILTDLDLKNDCKLIAMYIKRWRRYALSFHIEALQADKYWYPTFQQYELCKLRDRYNHIMLQAGRGVGKTAFLCSEVIRHLLCYRIPGLPVKVPITGPSGGQLDDVSWAEIDATLGRLLPWLKDRFELTAESLYCKEIPKNWFASPRTAKKENPGSLQGQHGSTFNVYDEGTHIPDEIYRTTLASMTQGHTWSMIALNPDKLSGYCYRVANRMKRSRWQVYRIDCYDCKISDTYVYPYFPPDGEMRMIEVNGLITDQWFIDQADDLGEGTPLHDAYVRGRWPTSEMNTLIKKDWVDQAFSRMTQEETEESVQRIEQKRQVPRSAHIERKRIIGVDPGYEGDPTGLVIRKGCFIEFTDHLYGLDPSQVAVQIIEICLSRESSGSRIDLIAIDSIGIGAGVISTIRMIREQMGLNKRISVRSVKASESAPKGGTDCRRLRDWLWWQLRSYFRDHRVVFEKKDDKMEKLAEEICSPGYCFKNGQVVVESKDDLKKRGLPSPNLADALGLTMKVDAPLHIKPAKKKIDIYRRSRKKRRRTAGWLAV